MKKAGAEKKRVRRSSAAVKSAASRDPATDTPPRATNESHSTSKLERTLPILDVLLVSPDSGFFACMADSIRHQQLIWQFVFGLYSEKQANKKDVFQLFAEKVRDHKDLVSRWAVLQETRVEYFRGKDFVSFLKNHPELKDILESDRHLEVEDIVNVLLSKNLLVRCDRVVKTVRPGKRKLSTWPAHLEIFPEQEFSDNDAFFAWTFVNKRPLWQTLLSLSWPVLTLAICLFPVYPHQAKLLILYSCAGILLVILCLLSVRALIFGLSWTLLGKRIWIFPNILAEEATLRELFRFWPQKDEEERPKLTARIFYATVAVLAILLLRHHAPDEAARARYQKRVSNIIDDVLEWDPRLALSGMMDSMQSETDNNVGSSEGEKAGSPDFVEHEHEHDETTDDKDLHNDHI